MRYAFFQLTRKWDALLCNGKAIITEAVVRHLRECAWSQIYSASPLKYRFSERQLKYSNLVQEQGNN